MIVQLHELLEFLVRLNGDEKVIDTINRAIDQHRAASGFVGQRRDFLRYKKLDGQLGKAMGKQRVLDAKALAHVLQRLQIRGEELFTFQENRAPWDAWEAGRKVVIVIGGKFAKLRESNLSNLVVGGQDAGALRVIEHALRCDAGIEYASETISLSPATTSTEAEKRLRKLLRDKEVGAVIVLGSECVNPLAAPVARRIFGGMNPRDMPVHFRWSYPTAIENPFLASVKVCAPDKEGIALSHAEEWPSLARDNDGEVERAIEKGRRGPFRDCGVLAMSAQEEKILVLCAGHGGCGTTAAVHGLSRVDYIEKRLLESATLPKAERYLPPGTILEPIWVRRFKKSLKHIDDFEFDEVYGSGWKFYFDDEDEDELDTDSRRAS